MTSMTNPEKITQLQCMSTNNYLQSQFMQWIQLSFHYKPNLIALLQDQFEALVAFAEYKLTISTGKPQPGDFLQNIRFMYSNFKAGGQRRTSKFFGCYFLLQSLIYPKKSRKQQPTKNLPSGKLLRTLFSNVRRCFPSQSF